MSSFLTFVISSFIGLYIWILLLRLWMQYVHCDFYNPLVQTVVRLTQPVTAPVRRLIRPIGSIDIATLLIALLLAIIKVMVLFFNMLPLLNQVALLHILSWGVLCLIKQAGTLLFYLLFLVAILSWVSQKNETGYLFYQLTEPFLAPIRRIVPNVGMLDFSVFVLSLILIGLNQLAYNYVAIWPFL